MERAPLRILVIEDDPDARANLRDVLELDDFAVETAGSVAEALAPRAWAGLAAVLIDRQLPDGSAEDLLPRLRRLAPAAALLVITGHADVRGAIAAMRLGADDYLLKPIDPDELRARLGHVAGRIRAAEEIRTLSSIPDESPNPVLRIGQGGVIRYANAASAPLLRLWQCAIGKPLPEAWLRQTEQALRTGQTREVEVACGPQTFSMVLAPIVGRGYVNLYGRDATERKQAEEALRRERDFAENVIETAQAIVLVLDRHGRILRFNRYLRDLSGYRLEDARDHDWFELFLTPEDAPRLREVFRQTLAGDDTTGTRNVIVTRSGQRRQIQWANRPLRDGRGDVIGVLAIGHDITALEEAQSKLLQSERLAAIGQMMTVLAHESGNALARARACLEMLALEVEDRPEATELIGRVHKAQDHLQQLYEEVRGYAAPLRLDREPWDVALVWRQAWQHLAMARQGRAAELREHRDGVDSSCPLDAFRLEQVFRNLFENALAACKDPVVLDVTCAEATLAGRPAVQVSVRDNGPGLTVEQRRRIFEPFYTTKVKGTGLGMAIARRIIEAHGGTLEVGTAATGAEIVLTLPR